MGIFAVGNQDPFVSSVFFEDFAATLNAIPASYIEVAFAAPGGSEFNQALYYNTLTPPELQKLYSSDRNVSFLNGCKKNQLVVIPGSMTRRAATGACISEKNILSFDADCKDFIPNWHQISSEEKHSQALQLAKSLIEKQSSHRVPLWLLLYSGNGIHLHFKLKTPFTVGKDYKAFYLSVLGYFECLFGIPFDKRCSNVARLMRLPLSSNWKEAKNPIKTEVFFYDSEAEAEGFLLPFQKKHQLSLPKITGDKQKIRDKLTLREVLSFFGYAKFTSWTETSDKILCSSPFKEDKTPSFYFCKARQLFFDFSSDIGGDLFTLIALLGKVDCKTEFKTVLQYAKKILGEPTQETKSVESGAYKLKESGVWFYGYSCDDQDEGIWVSSWLTVIGYTRDRQNQSWGRLLQLRDQDGKEKTWAMSMEYLAGDGLELRKKLLSLGVLLNMNRQERHHLLQYLLTTQCSDRLRSISRIGWMDHAFVFPDGIYGGDPEEKVTFQSGSDHSNFQIKGTLAEWQEQVGRYCEGNSRLILALCTAFASPLLHLTGSENFGIHLVGESSMGKTIALTVAGSVWGGGKTQGYRSRWKTTINGLEGLAAKHQDALLVLDELGEVSPHEAGAASYMLANGAGKVRGTKEGGVQEPEEWRLIFLSAGEIDLATHMQSVGERTKAGQEIRMLSVEADAEKGFGLFENIHEFPSAVAFVTHLRMQSLRLYGTPIRAFIEKLTKESDIQSKYEVFRSTFQEKWKDDLCHGQKNRMLERFTLLSFAGKLAQEYGVLPTCEIEPALITCYESCRSRIPDSHNIESAQILTQVRYFLQQFGMTHFPDLTDGTRVPLLKCFGFRKSNAQGTFDWLIPSEIFREEICKGYSAKTVLKALREVSMLCSADEKGTRVERLPIFGKIRVYSIKAEILAG